MEVVLYKCSWFRFINIFLNTFTRFYGVTQDRNNDKLIYNITYLKIVCLSSNEGFYFTRYAEDNQLYLTCSECKKKGANLDRFLQILKTISEGRTCYSSTSRFLRNIRRDLTLFHQYDCFCFVKDKQPATQTDYLTLLNAFEIVRQLHRSGLLLGADAAMNISAIREPTGDHIFDSTCQVCFTKRATLATPCGHLFQCIRCWYAYLYSQQADQIGTIDNDIDLRQLRQAIANPDMVTHIGFLRYRSCPVCRGKVIAIQYIFI